MYIFFHGRGISRKGESVRSETSGGIRGTSSWTATFLQQPRMRKADGAHCCPTSGLVSHLAPKCCYILVSHHSPPVQTWTAAPPENQTGPLWVQLLDSLNKKTKYTLFVKLTNSVFWNNIITPTGRGWICPQSGVYIYISIHLYPLQGPPDQISSLLQGPPWLIYLFIWVLKMAVWFVSTESDLLRQWSLSVGSLGSVFHNWLVQLSQR